MSDQMRLIFDAHLDLAWNALSCNRDQTESIDLINHRENGMIDYGARQHATACLPEIRKAGIAICLATIIARARRSAQPSRGHRRIDVDYGTQEIAYSIGQGQLAYYRWLESQGQLKTIHTARALDAHWLQWQQNLNMAQPIGVILAMEGADPILNPGQAEVWFDQGLRSVMLSHFGKSHYSVGTGEDGPLTPRGIDLLKEFERIGMILDVTHSSDQSFFESLDRFGGPLMASHSNCRALVPGNRQLTDEQIKLLCDRGAVIGIAMDARMLEADWCIGETKPDVLPLARVINHVDHICSLAGSTEHVAIGSDLDGGFGNEQTPRELKTIADLRKLEGLLKQRGYCELDIDNIFYGNWLRFFRRSLPN